MRTLSSLVAFDQPKNQTIYFTDNRMNFFRKIFEKYQKIPKKDKNQHLLTGTEGIGKAWTLLLFSHLIHCSQLRSQIFLFFIPDCDIFIENPLKQLKNELIFAYENCESLHNSTFLFDEIKSIKNFFQLDQCLRTITDDTNIMSLFLVAGQLNSIPWNCTKNFLDIYQLSWNLKISSHSATNIEMEEFSSLFKKCLTSNGLNIIDHENLRKLLAKYKYQENQIQKIEKLVGTNPREALLIVNSTGANLDEKISCYKSKRRHEIIVQNSRFMNQSTEEKAYQIKKSIYYMDQAFSLFLSEPPKINQQFMRIIYNENDFYQIVSSFPFAGEVLKNQAIWSWENQQQIQRIDFAQDRLMELEESLKFYKNEGVIGCLFEEIVHVTFEQSLLKKTIICCLPSTKLYALNNVVSDHINLVRN